MVRKQGFNALKFEKIDENKFPEYILSVQNCAAKDYDKMIEFWGKHSIIDLRRELGVERRKDVHPQYIEIDREKLKILILKGFNALEITEKLKLNSTMTVYRRIYEFWGKNLRDLQKEWNIKTHIQKLGEEPHGKGVKRKNS